MRVDSQTHGDLVPALVDQLELCWSLSSATLYCYCCLRAFFAAFMEALKTAVTAMRAQDDAIVASDSSEPLALASAASDSECRRCGKEWVEVFSRVAV